MRRRPRFATSLWLVVGYEPTLQRVHQAVRTLGPSFHLTLQGYEGVWGRYYGQAKRWFSGEDQVLALRKLASRDGAEGEVVHVDGMGNFTYVKGERGK